MQGKKPGATIAFAAILIALLLAACGGGSGAAETTAADSADGSAPGSGARPSAWNDVNEQFREEILSLDGTGSEAELENAAAAVNDYLAAHAEEDWQAVCANLAKEATDQLDLVASQPGNLKGKGCVGILKALTPPLSAKVQRESTVIDASSLRFEDEGEVERAYFVYRGVKGTRYAISMLEEDGTWKIGTLAVLPIS